MFTWADDSHILRMCAGVDPERPRAVYQIRLYSSTAQSTEEDWSTASCVVRHGHGREGDGATRICEGKTFL